MKKILIVAVLIAASLSAFGVTKKDNEAKQREQAAVKANLDNRDYVIEVSQALPSSGRSVPLTSRYSLTVKSDSLRCYLPYFGRAYSIPYGGGEGLIFDSIIRDYSVTQGKRDVTKISFTTRTDEDTYQFFIDVFANGSSSIKVQPNNKQAISFIGTVKMNIKTKEAE